MAGEIKRIGVLTAGGDCPGLNAVIRAAVKTAVLDYKVDVIGIEEGFDGLINRKIKPLRTLDVAGILDVGGTILGTSNTSNPFAYMIDGRKVDVSEKVIAYVEELGLDALITVGGDGTLSMSKQFCDRGLNIVGVPKTIDNDLNATDRTFGFDSAVRVVAMAHDMIRTTAMSHHRVMIIETMGRYAGWIALEGGLAGGSDIILIPEIPFTIDNICNICTTRHNVGKKFTLITVSEGVKIEPGKYVVQKVVEGSTDPIRLGGVGFALANEIEEKISMEVRVTVLGHLQRGGSPTAFDRILATKLGSEAVHQVMKKNFSTMVSVRGENIVPVKLEDAVNKQKLVTLDDPVVKYARSTGVSFGDESL